MAESDTSPMRGWRYGIHPRATEMRIRSLGRVELQLGEALRLEMTDADPGQDGTVHMQYYIATDLGPWALWLSCDREDLEAAEASLRELTPLSEDGEPTQPPDLLPFLRLRRRK